MATKARQSARQSGDADRVTRGKDEKRRWRHAAAIADAAGEEINITPEGGPVIETRKPSAERLDGYAQAA